MYKNTASTGQAVNSSAEEAESSRSLIYRASSKSGFKSYRENYLENKTKQKQTKTKKARDNILVRAVLTV